MNCKVLLLCAMALLVAACSDEGTEGAKFTGPLSVPGDVTYTSQTNSIHFEWNAVEDASSYEVTLAPEESPSDKETVSTTNTYCDFNNLDEGCYYVFTLMTVCADNPEYNSDTYEMRVATLEPNPLSAPENLKYISVESRDAIITWTAVSGASAYKVTATTGGNEVYSEIETSTLHTLLHTLTNLEPNTRYTASVKALYLATGEDSQYDSPASTVSFTTKEDLIAPTVSEVITTHGMCIMEWDLSSAAQMQQTIASDDPYEFRVADADGNVLRTMPNCSSWNFTRYKYMRIAFGGLEPNTTYLLGIRRISKTSSYGDSDWAELEVTTTSAPDKSGYLLYWDFENVPVCANPQYRAFGFTFSGDTTTDYSDPNNITYTGVNNETIYTEKINPGSNSKHNNQSFFDNYMPGVTVADFLNDDTFNVGVSVGMMKFGSGNDPSWLLLPALSQLTGATDLLVEFEASSYFGVGSTGDKYDSSIEVEFFTFEVTGEGTIDASTLGEGESLDSTGKVATLKNPGLYDGDDLGWGQDRYYFAPHAIVVKDATPETRIKMYTALIDDNSNHRMWMDNLKISLYNE